MKQRILVVDDDRDILKFAQFALRGLYDVAMASSADNALRLYADSREWPPAFDAVVLDIAMANETGLSVARKIRDGGDTVPLLFFTGQDRALNCQAAEDLGARYLVKPQTADVLEATVKGMLEGAGEG